MRKKYIEINCCFECPYCYWNEDYKNFECNQKNNKMIYAIENIPVWCPLSDAFTAQA